MVEGRDEWCESKPICTIYANCLQKTIAHILHRSGSFSAPMKRSVRPVFSLLLLIVVAATFGCRVAIRNGFGSIYGDGDGGGHFWGSGSDESSANNPPLDFPLFNSTLLKLAEIANVIHHVML